MFYPLYRVDEPSWVICQMGILVVLFLFIRLLLAQFVLMHPVCARGIKRIHKVTANARLTEILLVFCIFLSPSIVVEVGKLNE